MKKTLSVSALLFAALPSFAQAPASSAGALPVRQVTLFTSGVSYTERGGAIDGDAEVPLMFRTAQINDILKSMVLLDEGGQVQPATYAARDPIGHTLQSFAVDVTQNLSQEEVLTRLRGAKVTVEGAKQPALTGQIVGIEQRQVAGEDGKPITAPFLNLLTEAGLTAVRLDADKTVRLLDERLNREFHEALALLASGSDEQRRQVLLHFSGKGKRTVHVGYVTEAPIWKMSYRLLVGGADPEKPGGKPYLQGWAMVENTSDDDWRNVRLSLVSGRPVSFIQDLYQPLYLPRPVVEPDIVASPYPQTHEENLQSASKPGGLPGPPGLDIGGAGGRGGFGGRGQKFRAKSAAGEPGAAGSPTTTEADAPAAADNSELIRQSVTAQASGQKAGELFKYTISTPVNLPRQQAAMIPVVAQDIEAEKVSLFNADEGSRFPLNAVRVHNTTGLHLKGGPVTLFDEGVYAGDARMEDIPPGDTRLLSYAVDLSVEGERQGPSQSSIETTVSLKRGVLIAAQRERLETTYTLKSKADKPRTVLIEHPFQAEYKLVTPEKAAERTAGLYRFAIALAPGKTQTLKVTTERPIYQSFTVVNSDLNTLVYYTNRKDISAKLRAALQEVLQRRRRLQNLQSQIEARNADIQSIFGDQERIRKNMAALDKSSALYKRYVSQLDAQETRIERLRQETRRLQSEIETATHDLRAYLDNLDAI